jgi:hypothetical protein
VEPIEIESKNQARAGLVNAAQLANRMLSCPPLALA